MLSKIIVTWYSVLIEVALWLFLVTCLVVGWNYGEGFKGAMIGLITGFLVAVMVFGAFLVLIDIRKAVREINTNQTKQIV